MTGALQLPAEFRLVTACCTWPPSERRNAAIRGAAAGGIDWDNLLRIVERQRVAGLVSDGLRCAGLVAPAAVVASLAAEAGDIARQALQLASEALRLQAALEAAGVGALFVKGSTLALLAYGKLGIKHAWDIDLLVLPADVGRAGAVLAAAGYGRVLPPASFSAARFQAWLEFARESIFRNDARGTVVELHWRLSDNSAQLAHITAASPFASVTISPGHALRTLQDRDLFAYLCQHGAHHGWSRLKWLADLSAWLASKTPDDVAGLYRGAEAAGVGRAAAQALLLCERLFALPLPAALSAELEGDRAVRWLVGVALDAMAGDADSRQTDKRPLGNLKIELSHFLLASGLRFWLQELHSKSIGWTDFQRIALPRPLYFLYPFLRVPSWAWRRATHLLRQSRQPGA
ncbi:MAG TPA: nucleotidyltransferase family protein [Rhizomicrobium sp.]|jgi:hypothetical protein|nr:nucleotidyltransferase family protein [Rhizomicrobium sp.]